MTEQHGEKRVRSLVESALFYVGIPAAALYPLGVVGVGIVLDRKAAFRVLEQKAPNRLVIDVAH